MRKYNDIEFIEKLKEYGYEYIDGEYKNQFSKLRCRDKDGYIVFVQFDKLENRKCGVSRFHTSNPYTIENIKLCLSNNPEYKCKYYSGEYKDSKSKLYFECECGNLFLTTFNNVRHFHKIKCDICSGYHSNFTYLDVKTNLQNKGYYLQLRQDEYTGITSTDLVCLDNEGYKYKVLYNSVMRGKNMETFSASNPFVIDNINYYLDKNTNGEYECIDSEYVNTRQRLNIKHKKCGRVFQNRWCNIYRKRYFDKLGNNKTGALCPFCDATQLESTHALVLKQVWCYEHNDTETEERSCINPNTHCSLPTDIVNHRLKIAIEVQSWFHDFDDQKKKDKIKKNYWVNKGYSFYALDQRDYTIIEMIQFFFPKYKNIPEYIDFDYSNKINDVQIQKLLNNGLKVPEIAKLLECKNHQIYDAIHYGRITYPDNYISADRTSVVRLDINLNYVDEFDSIEEAKTMTGCKNISGAVNSKTHFSGGYYWIERKSYYDNNYSIQKSRLAKFYIPVDQYDKDDNFIAHYDTIINASKKYNCTNYAILQVMNGKAKSRCGYIWRYSNIT